MGSQRRLTEALIEQFVIPENKAWELTRLIEKINIGPIEEKISDAIYQLVQYGDTTTSFLQLKAAVGEYLVDVGHAEEVFTSLQRRHVG